VSTSGRTAIWLKEDDDNMFLYDIKILFLILKCASLVIRLELYDTCALLGRYVTRIGNLLLKFRNNLSGPSLNVKDRFSSLEDEKPEITHA
jgi:hypothetical protein